ncbi:MAG TPA: hypothetical protein VKB30_07490 [Candidatus Limnocylindrales bacterium]|nr:hypothetical protein [Candidatus Limnocylindrales bacterium]
MTPATAMTTPRAARLARVRTLLAGVLALPVVLATARLSDAGGVLLLLSYGVPGLVLAVRRPRQPIAWLLLLMAIGLGLGTARVSATVAELLAGTADALGEFTAWANGTGWVLVFVGLIGIALVFPSGAFPTGRWGRVGRLLIATTLPVVVLLVGGPVINVTLPGYASGVDVPNPYALPFLAGAGMPPGFTTLLWLVLLVPSLVAGMSLVARFRESTGQARLQYRWLASALALVGIGSVAWALVTNVLRLDVPLLAAGIVGLTYPAIPIAVVVAVLRYRLYEIDRLVSRTLGWALATAAVVAMFVVAVLGLQAALAGITQGATLAVAASTLLAFAAFQPVRARVQAFVDRRFDRPRLEAERSLAAYGERLQHEVDLATLTRDVEGTVAETLRPTAATLWIRPARPGRP